MPGNRKYFGLGTSFPWQILHICMKSKSSRKAFAEAKIFPISWHFRYITLFFTQMNGLHLPRHQPTNLLGFWLNIIIFKCKNWYIWMNRNITMLLLIDFMVRINSVIYRFFLIYKKFGCKVMCSWLKLKILKIFTTIFRSWPYKYNATGFKF